MSRYSIWLSFQLIHHHLSPRPLSVCLDYVWDEIFLRFVEKMVGPMILFMHFLVLFMSLTVLF